jgi:type VI secretion system protein ImpL
MTHPGPTGVAGAKITAVTFDGRTVEVFNEPGQFGLQRMIAAAQRRRKDNQWFELRWTAGNVAVTVDLKITSSAEASGADGGSQGKGFVGLRLPETIVGKPAMPVVATTGGGQ